MIKYHFVFKNAPTQINKSLNIYIYKYRYMEKKENERFLSLLDLVVIH